MMTPRNTPPLAGAAFGLAFLVWTASRAAVGAECTPLPSGMLGWWSGEGSPLNLMNGQPGAMVGDAGFAGGFVDQCFRFDGSGDFVKVLNDPAVDVGEAFTIEFWMNAAHDNHIGDTYQGLVTTDFFGIESSTVYPRVGIHVYASTNQGASFVHTSDINGGGAVLPSAEWHHVAGTYDGAELQLFIDGEPYGMPSPLNGRISPMLPDSYLAIGSEDGRTTCNSCIGTRYFMGQMDEVGLYNRALAPEEIRSIFLAGAQGKCLSPSINKHPVNQTVASGATVTFEVEASGPGALTYQWDFNGTPLPGAEARFLTLTGVEPAQSGAYAVTVSNFAGVTLSQKAMLAVLPKCAVAPEGLVAWWRAEGDSVDAAGTNHALLRGGAAIQAGRVGGGFSFDGVSGFAEVPDHPWWVLGRRDFGIEFWVMFRSLPVTSSRILPAVIFIGNDEGNYEMNKWFLSLAENQLWLHVNGPGVGSHFLPLASFTPELNRFYHLALVRSGSRFVVYRDGLPAGSQTSDLELPNAAAPLTIGQAENIGFLDGVMDEVSMYSRALSDEEVAAIAAAGPSGKCGSLVLPFVMVQPRDQTVEAGGRVTFAVEAGGSLPLTYEWFRDQTNSLGLSGPSLTLTNAQPWQAGSYSVVIRNSVGAVTSLPAWLTVGTPPCTEPTPDLVSWWRAEGTASDQLSANDGFLLGNGGYAKGMVGEGFALDGDAGAVFVADTPSLRLTQAISVDAWVYPTRSGRLQSVLAKWGVVEGNSSYALSLLADGRPRFQLSPNGFHYPQGGVTGTSPLPLNEWTHLAATYDGAAVRIYVNGLLAGQGTYYEGIFPGTLPLGIGGMVLNAEALPAQPFAGRVDEITIHRRALSALEVQKTFGASVAGRCLVSIPPMILVPPASQSVQARRDAVFEVHANGTFPLTFQWSFQGNALPAATNSTLTLTNVGPEQAGAYTAVVMNPSGSATSSVATLTVTYPPALVRVTSTNAAAGNLVTVPILLDANGDENAVGFSLVFDRILLAFEGFEPGSGVLDASQLVNTNEVANGRVGVALSFPTGHTFSPGVQEVARLTFRVGIRTQPAQSFLSFADFPIRRQVANALGHVVPSTFEAGLLSIAPAVFEADIAPRPNGDRDVTVSDWVMVGRFATKLEAPAGTEFARADCAPRASLGDGLISITDWVQAGRYAARLDPLAVLGGPGEPAPMLALGGRLGEEDPSRALRVANTLLFQDQAVVVPVYLESEGGENALGFSIGFDSQVLRCMEVVLGAQASQAALQVNMTEVESGRVAAALALPAGQVFPAGVKEVARLRFLGVGSASGEYPVMLTDNPVRREFSDANASPLEAQYLNGLASVNPLPSLQAARTANNLVLNWPLWGTNFLLQEATGPLGQATPWSDVSATPTQTSDAYILVLPIGEQSSRFYRLLKR